MKWCKHWTRALYRRKKIEPVGSYLILSNSYQPHLCLQLEFALLVADCRSNPPYPDARVNIPNSSNMKPRHHNKPISASRLSPLLRKNGSRQPTSVIPGSQLSMIPLCLGQWFANLCGFLLW